MKNMKYNILTYFDNHIYRKIAIDVNSSYAENFIDKEKQIFKIQFISGLVYKKYIGTILNDSVPSAIQQCMPSISSGG